VLSFGDGNLPRRPDQPVSHLDIGCLCRWRVTHFSDEPVSKSVYGPHEFRCVRRVTQAPPNFFDQAGEIGVEYERRRPQLLLQLGARQCPLPVLDKDQQEVERLGREVDFLTAIQKPAGIGIERKGIEPKGHLWPRATIEPIREFCNSSWRLSRGGSSELIDRADWRALCETSLEGPSMHNYELTNTSAGELSKMISPAQHAVLDYGVAATFLAVGLSLMSRHRAASVLALLNGGMVLGMSMLTKYPGGVFPRLSFKAHRTGDFIQGIFAGRGSSLASGQCFLVSQTIQRRGTSTDRQRARPL
jgi:hypothetical protein